MHILVIEDEPKVGGALREGLEAEHYEVTVAHTGEDGFYEANARTFDLIILDLMLPGRDGLDVLRTLRLVLVNLLDNAIKYTPDGGRITVRLRASDDRVVVAVKDTGPGIPPDDQEQIFDRFYRVDAGRSRDGGGCGLGLAIAERVARLNGGRLEVESTPGEGSTFRLVLPSGSEPVSSDQS